MMEYIMHDCVYWGKRDCHEDVASEASAGEEKTHIWPVGEAQQRLDDICKKCDYLMIEVKERKCPACTSENIQPFEYLTSTRIETTQRYNYKCDQCGCKLVSLKRLP